jgi:lysozyme family protein
MGNLDGEKLMTFDEAFSLLLGHEGDFSDHPADPGGKTRFGITEEVARRIGYRGNMQELPVDLAKRIYREEYWNPIRADELPAPMRYPAFDAAVNSGVRQSVLWMQRAAGVAADGALGPRTMTALHMSDHRRIAALMLAQRLRFMASLPNWPAFSRGWANRIADLMERV